MVLALKQTKLATFGQSLKGASLQPPAGSARTALRLAARGAATKTATVKLAAKPAPPKKTGTVKLAAKPAPPKKTGTVKLAAKPAAPAKPAGTIKKAAGTVKIGGTSPSKRIESIPLFTPSEKTFRPKQFNTKPAPKILARVEQLRLLSKLEQAGLLSAIEKSGLTLSAIEKSGLLSKAESLGLISAAADRNTPSALFTLATVLLAAGPALVYFTPDDSTALVALQVLGALVCVAGGAAAYGGASLLASLQK